MEKIAYRNTQIHVLESVHTCVRKSISKPRQIYRFPCRFFRSALSPTTPNQNQLGASVGKNPTDSPTTSSSYLPPVTAPPSSSLSALMPPSSSSAIDECCWLRSLECPCLPPYSFEVEETWPTQASRPPGGGSRLAHRHTVAQATRPYRPPSELLHELGFDEPELKLPLMTSAARRACH